MAAAYREPMSDDAGAGTAAKSPATVPHSPWHSPVPYLFGGLAAMLGLIAFALLILACSYWKLSGFLEADGDGDGGRRDIEAGKVEDEARKAPIYEEKFLVIMAGEEKPTFLATPMWSSRSSSFGDNSSSSSNCCSCDKNEQSVIEMEQSTLNLKTEGSSSGRHNDQIHQNQNQNNPPPSSSS